MTNLPRIIQESEVKSSPIIVQGSKAKLIRFIMHNIECDIDDKTYFEPFLGSGIVALNIKPKKAILSDNNPHIIRFFQDLQNKKYTAKDIKDFLLDNKPKISSFNPSTVVKNNRLLTNGEVYYYQIRDEFNKKPNSLLFLLLNMTCINNLMRFNSKGEFNAPFMYDSQRGLTNIHDIKSNYVEIILERIQDYINFIESSDITFLNEDFMKILPRITENDFAYFDPPYLGRDTQYYEGFTEEQNQALIDFLNQTKCSFSYSNWYEDENAINPYIDKIKNCELKLIDHHYIMGNTQRKTRQKVIECLLISKKTIRKKNIGMEKWVFPSKII